MKKKDKKIVAWVIVSLIVVGILYYTPFLEIIGLTEPGLCGDLSYDYQCVCQPGYVKQGFLTFKCVPLPPAPPEVTFPIETWEEARAYIENLMGGFKCTGENIYDSILEGEINEQCGKYGSVITGGLEREYKGHIVILECRNIREFAEGKPQSGHIVFSVRFDPNDGHVYELSCSDNFITDCPGTFKANWKLVEPTCGDTTEEDRFGFCCHYGESFENCPEDCPEPLPEGVVCGSEVGEYITENAPNIGDVDVLEQLCYSFIGGNVEGLGGWYDQVNNERGYKCHLNTVGGQWEVVYNLNTGTIKSIKNPLSSVYCFDMSEKEEIECNLNTDCGVDTWSNKEFCWGTTLFDYKKVYECVNPGTTESYCKPGTELMVKGSC